MAAPAFGSIGTLLASSTSTPAFAVPASVASGDIIVVAFWADVSTTTISAFPSGFAAAENSPRTINAGGTGNCVLHVAWKRATAADTGTYSFTLSATVFVYGNAVRYTGCVASGNPWDSPTVTGDGGATAGTTTPDISVTTAGPDRMLFFAGGNNNGDAGTWTAPAGFNERQGGTNATNCEISDKVQTAQGSSGNTHATTASGQVGDWLGALIGTTVTSIPYSPPRSVQGRDPGETWWTQRDRRDANTVGSSAPAAVPAPPPRTVTVRDYGEVPWLQAPRRDPALLTSAQLENELLGGGDTARHYLSAATNTDRREVPQQRAYYDTTLLATAQLENELLGSADDVRRHAVFYRPPAAPQQRPALADQSSQPAAPDLDPTLANWPGRLTQNTAAAYADRREVPQQRTAQAAPDPVPADPALSGWWPGWLAENRAATHTDRRLVPQQRPYISDPSFYPTVAPTDPLTVAWGAGGTYWLLYNRAATHTDRRLVPQQRDYKSDPLLLLQALLENELLGGADDLRRRYLQAGYYDRREVPQQRGNVPAFTPDADPLLLVDSLRRATFTPAYTDRREVPQQPHRWTLYFDAGPGLPPLTLAWGAGGTLWHLYNRPSRARPFWPQTQVSAVHECVTYRPFTGTTSRPTSGTTARPYTGVTERPC